MAMEKKNFHEMIISLYLLLLLSSADFVAGQSGNGSPSTDSYEFNPKFNPSMGILILIFILAFFFMGFFAVYIRQCGEQEGGSVRPAISGIGRLRRAQKGVDPSIMETLPIFNYSEVKDFKIGKGALECAVCLNEFEDEETLRLLPKCDHVFHSECIDAWLDSHTTCPVCRANLVPESGETKEANLQVSVPEGESNEENRRREIDDDSQNPVSILVTNEQNRDLQQSPEVINLTQIRYQNRPTTLRSTRSRFTGKFPRSHSTGHSLVRPGENCERFTLRLPEDVRKQIMSKKLDRTTSCVVFPTEGSSRRGYRSGGEGSSRRGYRSGGEGSSRGKYNQFVALDGVTRSDRWVFSMAPPFLTRKGSVGSSWKSATADGEITGTNKAFFTSVKTPFDCLGAKVDGAGQCSWPLV